MRQRTEGEEGARENERGTGPLLRLQPNSLPGKRQDHMDYSDDEEMVGKEATEYRAVAARLNTLLQVAWTHVHICPTTLDCLSWMDVRSLNPLGVLL